MSVELSSERPLFGGAISTVFPQRFQDVSNIRDVLDHQEVFVDPSRDESLIFELLDFKTEVDENGSASWFLTDLAREQDAEGFQLIEQSQVFEAPGLSYRNIPAVATTALGEMAVSKGRQGREAQNLLRVYVANLRLKGVDTDVLVSAYEPILINPLSESAAAVGSGLAVPALQSGIFPCLRLLNNHFRPSKSMIGVFLVHQLEFAKSIKIRSWSFIHRILFSLCTTLLDTNQNRDHLLGFSLNNYINLICFDLIKNLIKW